MVLGSKLRQRGKRCGDLDYGCRIESDIAVEFGVDVMSIQRLNQKPLRFKVETPQGQLVKVIRLADRGQSDWKIGVDSVWRFTSSRDVLRIGRRNEQS